MFNWIHRRIDLRILWPACKDAAGGNLAIARQAFVIHMGMDSAWQSLCDPMTPEQLGEFIRRTLI